MNPFDIGILVVFGYCLIRGFFKGFVREIFSLIGVIGGFYGASTYYPVVAKLLSRWIPGFPNLNVLSFLLILFVGFVVISLLGTAVKYLLTITFMGWIDRLFGVVTGSIRGVLVVSILLMAATAFVPDWKPLMEKSFLAPKITAAVNTVTQAIPKDMTRGFTKKFQEINEAWKAKIKKKTINTLPSAN